MSLKFAKEPKATCFAYNKEKKRCNALSELVCSYKDECAFYKHYTQFLIKCQVPIIQFL